MASKAQAKKTSSKKKAAKKPAAKKPAKKKAAGKPAAKKRAPAKKPAAKKKSPAKKKAPKAKKPAAKPKKAKAAVTPKPRTAAEKAIVRKATRRAVPVEIEPQIDPEERKRLAEEERQRRAVMYKRAKVPKGYIPSEKEPFMNAKQLAYFKNKLLDWRDELLRESTQTLHHLQETSIAEPDLADRASAESDRSLELRTRDRERKLISKIDSALERILDGSYGYCEETDEPIGLKRLEARPIATLIIEAQERHERREKVYRDE
jgi:DnaK suppressor protein